MTSQSDRAEEGDVGGRFRVERLLGEGAMGKVFLARDLVTGERVAVKLARTPSEADVARSQQEARLLSSLQHPGVVRYVAHGSTPSGEAWLAMEWLRGEDLASRLRREPLNREQSLSVARSVAEALAFVHAHGVVHRDLKPANLHLVDGDPRQVKLLDFGVARGDVAMTQTGAILGTPLYMSPEQVRGEKGIDARADLFSLGCVLYECLTRKPPFLAENAFAVMTKVIAEEVPRLSSLFENVPAELDAMLAALLAKRKDERPASAGVVAETLSRLPLSAAVGLEDWLPPRQGLTHQEQRWVCVAFIGGVPGRADPVPEPNHETDVVADTLKVDNLTALAGRHGALLEHLPNKGRLLVFTGVASPTDLAHRAARCALAFAKALPGQDISLAMGRALMTGNWPVGEAIDRCAALHFEADLEHDGPAIRLHEEVANLLDASFVLDRRAGQTHLVGEAGTTKASRLLLGRPTPCVGRERDLQVLRSMFEECRAESSARPVVIIGPPGIGKSRLRQEFFSDLDKAGTAFELWIGRGDSINAGAPLGMLSGAMKWALGISDADSVEERRKKVLGRAEKLLDAEAGQRVASFLGELVGAPFDDTRDPHLRAARRDPMLMGDQLRRAFEDFLAAAVRVQPVALVLEDLHWGDAATVAFLDGAIRLLKDQPLFVLALARPELHDQFPGLWKNRAPTELRLGSVSRRAGERLVQEALGASVPASVAASIVERAQGNPFFLEELIRLTADGRHAEMPSSVVGVVQLRLEGLPATARRVLRAASVFGQVFSRGGVDSVLGGELALSETLASLVDQELVSLTTATSASGETTYAFRHALVRDAAYAMLTGEDQTLGHRLAGEWLERVGGQDPLSLAEHFERGGLAARAAPWFERAAAHALEANDLEGCIARVDRGLALGAQDELAGKLNLLAATSHNWRGAFEQGHAAATRAVRALQKGDPNWHAAVERLIWASGALGQFDTMLASIDDLILSFGELPPTTQAVAAISTAYSWAASASLQHHFNRIGELLNRLELATLDPLATAYLLSSQGQALSFSPDNNPEVLLNLSRKARAAASSAGDSRLELFITLNVASALLELGALTDALETGRACLRAASRSGNPLSIGIAHRIVGQALSMQGTNAEAALHLRHAASSAGGEALVETLCELALTNAKLGQMEGALTDGMALVRTASHSVMYQPFARAVLSHLLIQSGDEHAALAESAVANRQLDQPGRPVGHACFIRLSHVEALLALHKTDEATAAVTIAYEHLMNRALRVHDEMLRASFLTCIPEHARTIELWTQLVRNGSGRHT